MRLRFCRTPFRSPKLRSALPSVVNLVKWCLSGDTFVFFSKLWQAHSLREMHCPARCTDSQRPIVRRGVLAQATVRGICGIGQQVEQAFAALIGWKIAAVFVLIDSVAFGKEMYCSFIFQIARVCFSLRLYYHLWREVFFSYLNTFQLRYEPWHEHNRCFKFSPAWLEQVLGSRTIIGAIASPSPISLMSQLSY